MPCMYNGKPVKGTKGACPINSTWVEDSQSEPSSDKNQLFADSRIFGDWFDPANYDKFKYKRGTVTRSMDDFFHKMGYTPPGWKPLSTRPNEEPVEFASGGSDSGRRGKATLDPQHTSRHGGEFKPTMMQKLGANMKNPEWWSESISGLPSDTRLMRLGQLMNYYGKTPKGRQASDDPSKLWAANEAASAKIKATKDAAKAKSAVELYGKKTIADLTTELIPDVKEMFGDTISSWSDNPNADDEEAMASIAGQVATNIKAMSLAFPNKTPGDIRKMALAKVAEDRDLDVY